METFLTLGESTVYGDHVDLDPIRKTSGACCAPVADTAPAAAACCSQNERRGMTERAFNILFLCIGNSASLNPN